MLSSILYAIDLHIKFHIQTPLQRKIFCPLHIWDKQIVMLDSEHSVSTPIQKEVWKREAYYN